LIVWKFWADVAEIHFTSAITTPTQDKGCACRGLDNSEIESAGEQLTLFKNNMWESITWVGFKVDKWTAHRFKVAQECSIGEWWELASARENLQLMWCSKSWEGVMNMSMLRSIVESEACKENQLSACTVHSRCCKCDSTDPSDAPMSHCLECKHCIMRAIIWGATCSISTHQVSELNLH
jgi:hypothetical protein